MPLMQAYGFNAEDHAALTDEDNGLPINRALIHKQTDLHLSTQVCMSGGLQSIIETAIL